MTMKVTVERGVTYPQSRGHQFSSFQKDQWIGENISPEIYQTGKEFLVKELSLEEALL